MVEVFTIGGGEYMVNTFNAVAAWTGGGGYKSLIKVVLVIGLIYSLLAVAFSMNFRAWMNWFLGATMIYLCLMVPTVDVRVTDRVNPDLAPATVANVPLGLGVMASFTSQVGDYLTRTAETVFVMPSQLNYSTNGMIYGSRLFDATRNFQIRDAEFATNLQAHFKQCAFGDIMLHRKSLTDLATSQDLWGDIGPGSPARSQQWLERDGSVESTIVTCQQAYSMLDAKWNAIIEIHAPIWGKEAYPRLTNALASQKLRQNVPIANAAFTNAAADFTGTMRQNTAINAFMQARDAMAGGSGAAAIDTFATTRADIQARNTYNSIAQQAMSWVPILNVVLTVVFYAMFPVIFPLFLMPQTGVQALKGYVTGFFYLASWGPLYVILHMICMSRGESAARGIADGGVTLATYAGIGAVNAETATIAGFMLMSVPFIAGGLARGALSVSSQATSILAPAQNAAEASALEQTTGNYAYGNVSYANQTSNMHQSNQYSDAPTMMTGESSFTYRAANGSLLTTTASGQQVIDATPAISKLPFTPNLTEGSVATESRQSALSFRIADGFEKAKREEISHLDALRNSTVHTTSNERGFDASSGSRGGSSLDQRQQRTVSDRDSIEERSAASDGSRNQIDEGKQTNYADQWTGGVKGNLGLSGALGAGGGKKGGGGGLSGQLSGGVTGDVGWNRSYTKADTTGQTRSKFATNEHTVSDANSSSDEQSITGGTSTNSGTFYQEGQFARSSVRDTRSQAIEESESKIRAYTESARHYRELGRSLEQNASFAESNGFSLSRNLSNELQEFYQGEERNNAASGVIPPLHATNLSPAQELARDAVIAKWATQRHHRIESELQGALDNSALKDMEIPSVGTAADVPGLRSGGASGGPRPVSTPRPDDGGIAAGITDATAGMLGNRHRRRQDARPALSSSPETRLPLDD